MSSGPVNCAVVCDHVQHDVSYYLNVDAVPNSSYNSCYELHFQTHICHSFIVAPVVMILSLGNNIYRHSIAEIFAGTVGIIVIVMLPNLLEFDWGFMETSFRIEGERDPASELLLSAARVTMLILGAILLLQQAFNVLRFIVPDSRLTGNKNLTVLLRGSVVRSEFGLKQAAIFKVHNMIKNALDVHVADSNSTRNGEDDQPNIASALLNYTKILENKESSDGFIWAWKTYLSGRLIDQEGIWYVFNICVLTK